MLRRTRYRLQVQRDPAENPKAGAAGETPAPLQPLMPGARSLDCCWGWNRGGGARPGRPGATRSGMLDLGHVAGLRAFRAVNDLEFDRLAFLQRPEATGALNRGVVDEDVTAAFALDEPVPLGVVEPLDLACDAHSCPALQFPRLRRPLVELTPGRSPGPGAKKKSRTVRGLRRRGQAHRR